MLKGINRNVIVVKGNGKSRFETVYFIMKKGCLCGKRDLIDEAEKIIGDSGYIPSNKGKSRKKISSPALFAAGCAVGIFMSSIIWLTLILL